MGKARKRWKCTRRSGANNPGSVKGEQGWVLMEVLTSVPAALMVLLSSITMFAILQPRFEELSIQLDQQFYARAVLQKISQDVKQSCSLEVINGGSVLRINDREGQELRYYLHNGKIYRSRRGSSIPITEHTSNLRFYSYNEQTLETEITMNRHSRSLILTGLSCRVH